MAEHGWILFDEIMKSDGFERAKNNYLHNCSVGIKTVTDASAHPCDCVCRKSNSAGLYSTVIQCKGKDLLFCQYGGSFPQMRFSRAKMSEVCCEIMAAYNALVLCGTEDDGFSGFFKLACEFEANGPYLLKSGHFGGDYRKIGTCLKAHGAEVSETSSIDLLEELAVQSECVIVSYRFDMVKIHTYLCFRDEDGITAVNRGGCCLYTWKNKSIRECLRNGRLLRGYAVNSRQF